MVVSGNDFSFFWKFSTYAWGLMISGSIVNLLSSITKFLASKYHSASSLQKLAFLPNVWQFIFDYSFMGFKYSGLELIGFTCLFVCYGIYLFWFTLSSCYNYSQNDDDSDYKQEKGSPIATSLSALRSDLSRDTNDEENLKQQQSKWTLF